MKKLFTLILCAVAYVAVYAQTDYNRLVVREKSGAIQPFNIEYIDSMFFYNIDGRVAADAKVNDVRLKAGEGTEDTVFVSVTRSESCYRYKITCLPKSRADVMTSAPILSNYISTYEPTSTSFYDDFTNAAMTGMGELKPETEYSILTLAYDEIGTPCEMSKADFTTPKKQIVGKPDVAYEITNVTPTTFTIKFTPNSDVKEFAITSFGKGELEQQFNQFGAWMGFANIGEMVYAWGIQSKKDTTYTWTGYKPDTEYDVYIQCLDVNGTYAPLIYVPVKTSVMGGDGLAEMTLEVKEFAKAGDGYYQRVVYTPNDQCAGHRDIIITEKGWNDMASEDSVRTWLTSDEAAYYEMYGEDDAKWDADPETTYYAVAVSKNAKGEWGPMIYKKFTTPKVSDEFSKPNAVRIAKRFGSDKGTGKAPAFILNMDAKAARGLQIK